MATIKQAQVPPANLKKMRQVLGGGAMPGGVPAPPAPSSSGLDPLAIAPVPGILTTSYDSIRQWTRNGVPQYRTFPLPSRNTSISTSTVKSIVEDVSSGGGGSGGSVDASDVSSLAKYVQYFS